MAILINNLEDVFISQIIQIAEKVKTLKIVTPNVNRFRYVEEKLYLEYGIALQITSNKEKALANTEIIINLDFDEVRLNQYEIFPNAIIVNIGKEAKINESKFDGEIFNYYKIEYNKEILDIFEGNLDFDKNVIYESMIYKKDTFSHIKKQLDSDNVRFIRTYCLKFSKILDKGKKLD